MGTNYYYRKVKNQCEHCGRCDSEEYHIGKLSHGWNFLFSDSKYKSARAWKQFLKKNPDNIFNEYDEKVSLKKMLEIIEHKGEKHVDARFNFTDSQGYDFTEGWFC